MLGHFPISSNPISGLPVTAAAYDPSDKPHIPVAPHWLPGPAFHPSFQQFLAFVARVVEYDPSDKPYIPVAPHWLPQSIFHPSFQQSLAFVSLVEAPPAVVALDWLQAYPDPIRAATSNQYDWFAYTPYAPNFFPPLGWQLSTYPDRIDSAQRLLEAYQQWLAYVRTVEAPAVVPDGWNLTTYPDRLDAQARLLEALQQSFAYVRMAELTADMGWLPIYPYILRSVRGGVASGFRPHHIIEPD